MSTVGQIRRPRYPFVYQDLNNPKGADFRHRHKLDQVVADAADEMDALVAVRDWSFQQFRTGDPSHWRLNADDILQSAREGGCFHCTFYAIVSVQALTSLGYIARRLNIDVAEADTRPMPHMVYDVWSNQLDQWVVMDSKANIHFEIDGRPLSALQLRRAYLEGQKQKIDVIFGHGKEKRVLPKDCEQMQRWARAWYQKRWNPPDDRWARQMPVMSDPRIYCFISVYGASDLFSRPISSNQLKYFPVLVWYDAHNRDEHWWLRPERKLEVYAVEGAACRVKETNDFEWPINRCELQVSQAEQDRLQVHVWTDTPNFSHFEFRLTSDQPWTLMKLEPNPADPLGVLRWILPSGTGTDLQVRSVNLANVGGVVGKVEGELRAEPNW